MEVASFIGGLAAVLTTSAFVPQAIKIIRTRKTKDISLLMYIVLTTGILCWLIYGILIEQAPIVFANSIGFTLTFTILVLKIKYGLKNGD